MPRVPVYDSQKVETRPVSTVYENTNFDSGLGDVAKGLDQAGKGVDQGVAAYREAKQKADAISANDALTQYQNENITALDGTSTGPTPAGDGTKAGLDAVFDAEGPPSGFLYTRGKGAAEKSADTYDYLDTRRKEIAESLANDEQRKLFLKHSDDVLRTSRARIEKHVSDQVKEAEVASIKGRVATTLNAIANDYTNNEEAAKSEEAVATTLRAFALSPEDANSKVAAWQEEVASTRLNKYIGAKDWKGADNLFAQVKDKLGTKAAGFQKQIESVKQDQEAEREAAKLVDSARNPENGRVDPVKAQAAIDAVPEGPLRDEVRQRADKRVAKAEADWTSKVKGVADSALSDYIKGGNDLDAITPSAKTWLIENAPKEWRALQNMARADTTAERQAARGVRAQETDAQRDGLIEARAAMAEHPDDFRGMTPGEFQRNWRGRLSDSGYKEAGRVFAELKKQPKGTEAEFNRFITDAVRGNEALKNKGTANQYKAAMGDLRRDFVAKNKHEPSLAEMQEMNSTVWKDSVEKGWLWDSHKPAFLNKNPVDVAPSKPDAAPATRAAPTPTAPAAAKPAMKDRALQLRKAGKSVKEITETLNAEGY